MNDTGLTCPGAPTNEAINALIRAAQQAQMVVNRGRIATFVCKKGSDVATHKKLSGEPHMGYPDILLCSGTSEGGSQRGIFYGKPWDGRRSTEPITPTSVTSNEPPRRGTGGAPLPLSHVPTQSLTSSQCSARSLTNRSRPSIGGECGDTRFRAASLLNGNSSVLDVCYRSAHHEAAIADFIKLRLPHRLGR